MLIVTGFKILHKSIIKIGIILILSFSTQVVFATEIPQLISFMESSYDIPRGLLGAIAKTESGSRPYAINVSGKSIIAHSKQEAASIISAYLDKGHTNIDIGIMQINWRWHNDKFDDVNTMLEPQYNIEYAAKLLTSLHSKYGSWQKAVRYYHSANEKHHRKYSKKVLVSWLES